MKRIKVWSMLAASAAFVCATVSQAAMSTWQALDEESTVAAVQVESGKELLNYLRKHTKFGAEILTEKRFNDVLAEIQKQAPDEWKEMESNLAKVGLKVEDFYALHDGPGGFAVSMEDRDGKLPRFYVTAWIEPGEQTAEKFYQAILKGRDIAEEEAPEGADIPKRVDTTIAGQKVVHFITTRGEKIEPEDFWDVPEEIWEKTQEERDAYFKKRQEEYNKLPEVVIDQVHTYLTRMDGRLLMVTTVPQFRMEITGMRMENENAKIDVEGITGAKEAAAHMARLIQSLKAGKQGGFVAKAMNVPGMDAAISKDQAWITAFVNTDPLTEMIELIPDPTAKKFVESMGFDGMGFIGMQYAFDRNIVKTGMFVQAPAAQRKGLMTLLNQKHVKPSVPAWVPGDVAQYGYFSFDLAQAFEVGKKLAEDAFGQQATQALAMMEMQMQATVGTGMKGLLSSIGTDHHMIQYPMTLKKGWDDEDYFGPPIEQKLAMVWKLQDQKPWDNIVKLAHQQIQMMGGQGPMTVLTGQGFDGVNIDADGQQMAYFKGNGYMSLAIGDGIAPIVMSSLNKGNLGADSFQATKTFSKAMQMMKPRDSWMFSVSDTNLVLNKTIDALEKMMQKEFDDNKEFMPEQQRLAMESFLKLMPKASELKDMGGVAVGYGYTTDDGLVITGVSELAPAE